MGINESRVSRRATEVNRKLPARTFRQIKSFPDFNSQILARNWNFYIESFYLCWVVYRLFLSVEFHRSFHSHYFALLVERLGWRVDRGDAYQFFVYKLLNT